MEPTNTVTYFVRSYFCYVCVGRSKKLKVKSLSHVRLCDSMDCSLPGSSVHGIFLAGLLEWIAISFSRGSSLPRDLTWVSCHSWIAGRFFTCWVIREAREYVLVVVQQLSRVQLFAAQWTAARQAFLSFTISWNLFKLTSSESVMPSNHLIKHMF